MFRKNKNHSPEFARDPEELLALKTLGHARMLLLDGPDRGYDSPVEESTGDTVLRFIKTHERVLPPQSGPDDVNNDDPNIRYVEVKGMRHHHPVRSPLSISEVSIINPGERQLVRIDFTDQPEHPHIAKGDLAGAGFAVVDDPADRAMLLGNAEIALRSVAQEVYNRQSPNNDRGPRGGVTIPAVRIGFIGQ